jgi:hypothetical protein
MPRAFELFVEEFRSNYEHLSEEDMVDVLSDIWSYLPRNYREKYYQKAKIMNKKK